MKTYTPEELKETIDLHAKWLRGEECGVRASLRYSNLSYSNLRHSNLRYADLRGADFSQSDLTGADLRGACLDEVISDGDRIKTLETGLWNITYIDTDMAIGCEQHALSEWWAFDDETISKMDENALTFWRKWKPILMQIMEVQS